MKGYVRRDSTKAARSKFSEVLQDFREAAAKAPPTDVPLGRIAAGSPVEAIEGSERLSFQDLSRPEHYALEVRGESMIEDHICSGDYVLVEKKSEVKDGDIVVALVDGTDATLKRFYREPDGTIRLQPANSSMQPIRVSARCIAGTGPRISGSAQV